MFFVRLKEWLGFEFGDDEPMDDWARKLDRRWRWVLSAGQWNGRLFLGMERLLVQYEGKRDPDPMITGDWAFQLVYDPRRWKIEQTHVYYDGPHCAYQFGPFEFRRSLGWCKKCSVER